MNESATAWQKCFRDGFALLMDNDDLLCLKRALSEDDGSLIQGATTMPPATPVTEDWCCEGACAIGFVGWTSKGLASLGEVSDYFGRMCYECDQRLGEPAACRYFLQWFDETPRPEMREKLWAEVNKILISRLKSGEGKDTLA